MGVTTDFKVFANNYHEQNKTLSKLPTNLIMSIIKQADGGLTAHKNKLNACFEEMLDKYQAEISIWAPGCCPASAKQHLPQILKKYNVEAEVYTYLVDDMVVEECKMWWSEAFNLPEELLEEDEAWIESPFNYY
jgi:hypothetical protein